jgi:hypothetical protein
VPTFAIVRGPVESEPLVGRGCFCLGRREIVRFKNFGSRLGMTLGGPIFDEPFAETTARRIAFAPRRTTFCIIPPRFAFGPTFAARSPFCAPF